MNPTNGNCADVVNRIPIISTVSQFVPESCEVAWITPPPFENSELLPGQIFVVPNLLRSNSVVPKTTPDPI